MENFIQAGDNMSFTNICFFGPSGSGKSTCAKFALNYFKKKNLYAKQLNIAKPLHNIQKYAYSKFFINSQGQDGMLLQFLAKHFESNLGPSYQKQIAKLQLRYQKNNLIIINSDCRNNAYIYLQQLNFIFIKVSTKLEIISKRLDKRGDISLASKSHPVEQTSLIPSDFVIHNNGTKHDLKNGLEKLLDSNLFRICPQLNTGTASN